jgi:hypothetical protein
MTDISCNWSRNARATPLSDPTLDSAATESGGEITSSSSTALKLALSSGRMDSFSSSANVVADATLFPSKLGGFAEPSDDDNWVVLSSVARDLTNVMEGRDLSGSSSFGLGSATT